MHHAVGVRIVMVQPEGVAEFMDRRLGGSFHQLLRSVVPESSDRDYRKTISDCRVTEHEVEAPVVEVDIGHGEDAVARLSRQGFLELGGERSEERRVGKEGSSWRMEE